MVKQNIFEIMLDKMEVNKPIRLIELFAGYGSQSLALKYLGVEFESWEVVEYDKAVIKAYNEIHSTNYPAIDIKDVQELECDNDYLNICTYSFPCQDLSKAGLGKGMTKGNNTRSGLLWEVERILLNTRNKPQVLLMENVPDVIGNKNIKPFQEWVKSLEEMGYSNYVELLNAKDYAVPQSRNRAFMISIMGEHSYTFPSKIKLKYRLKYLLESEVDEKYYLSEKMVKGMQKTKPTTLVVPSCLNSKVDGKQPSLQNRIDTSAIATAITTSYQPSIKIPEATKQGYALAKDGGGVYINRPHQKRGVVQKGMIQTLCANGNDLGVVTKGKNLNKILCDSLIQQKVVNDGDVINHGYSSSRLNRDRNPIESKDGIMPTLTCRSDVLGIAVEKPLRIRKLTPRECFRLMGVKDEDSNKLSCSNSRKYSLAGNSIVVTVLMALFGELLGVEYKSKIEHLLEQLKGGK